MSLQLHKHPTVPTGEQCSDDCDDSVHTHILQEVDQRAVRYREGPAQQGQDQEEYHQEGEGHA